jgi:hypothetical protein
VCVLYQIKPDAKKFVHIYGNWTKAHFISLINVN